MNRLEEMAMLTFVVCALSGCVERRLFITSDPPGALVHLNGVEVGVTPVEVDFTFYGVYDVQLEKDGYEPLVTKARAKGPWYDQFGPDMLAEALPGTVKSSIHWSFTLKPAIDDPDAVAERARAMRSKAFEAPIAQPKIGAKPN